MPYSAADIRARQFLLRMLLVAPAKQGKTTCAVATCPKPCFVLETDGEGALDYAVFSGLVKDGEMDVEDISSSKNYKKAISHLRANPTKYKTLILDNLTFLAQGIFNEVSKELKDGRQIYPEVERQLLSLLSDLSAFKAHLIVIGHCDPVDSSDSKIAGSFQHVLSISGKAKTKIPSLMQDWVWLQVSIDEGSNKPKYEFLIAPEGHWKQGVRSIKIENTSRMEANISRFIQLAEKRAAKTTLKPVEKPVKSTESVVVKKKEK